MNIILIGGYRCGFSLASAILNCSIETQTKSILTLSNLHIDQANKIGLYSLPLSPEDASKLTSLDTLNQLCARNQDNIKFIWLIRDPIISACSYYYHLNWHPDKSLYYWYRINTICWYFYHSIPYLKMRVRFEDILLGQLTIKKVYEFIGIHYNKQYLKYGDFDQLPCEDVAFQSGRINIDKIDCYNKSKVPGLNKYWKNYKNYEMVIETGYYNALKD